MLQAFNRLNFRVCLFRNSENTNFLRRKLNFNAEQNKATVIHDEADNAITLSFKYVDKELKINKTFNFKRRPSEKCSYVLSKISEKVNAFIERKTKNKYSDLEDKVIKVNFISKENKQIHNSEIFPCVDTFLNPKEYFLRIGNIDYVLDVNPPLLTSLQLPKNVMAGFFVYPSKLEGVNCDLDNTILKWYRSKLKFESQEKMKCMKSKHLIWEEIGEGFKICPSSEDLSRLLKVVGTPCSGSNTGISLESISETLITSGPSSCPFEKRHLSTSEVLNKNYLRVVSYNILADFYADSEYSRTKLFPTCPPFALAIEYRKQLLSKELSGYNADLICLQEVDKYVFQRDLKPLLSDIGFDGKFEAKGRVKISEGLAIFHRKEKLKLKEEECYLLSQELESNPLFSDLLEKLKINSDMYDSFLKQKTILQVNVFACRDDPSQTVVVGVTHLYSEPSSNHVRLLQAGMCLAILQNVLAIQNKQSSDSSLIFCGDFNSKPDSAVYRFLTSQHVDENEADWHSKPGEEVGGVSLSHDLELSSACGTPAYTNYTLGFQGCLDYIFYQSDKFSVKQVVSLPSHEDVIEHGALPSLTFPSDHIALVADLEWTNKNDK